MRYRISMSIEVESVDDADAFAAAEKLAKLLKSPVVRMAVASDGIRLVDDGHPVVYAPQREVASG